MRAVGVRRTDYPQAKVVWVDDQIATENEQRTKALLDENGARCTKASLRLPRSSHGISYIDENGGEHSHERAHVQGLRRHRKISAEEVHRWQLRRFASTSSELPTPRPAPNLLGVRLHAEGS